MAEILANASIQKVKELLKEETPLHAFLTSRDAKRTYVGSLTKDELQSESDSLLGEGNITAEEARKISYGVVADYRQVAFKAYRLVILRRILGSNNQEARRNLCGLFESSDKKVDRKRSTGLACLAKADPKEIKELFASVGWPDKKTPECKEPNCYGFDGVLIYLKSAQNDQVLTALRRAISESLKNSLEQIKD